MACEEAGFYYRWRALEQIAAGVMPDGMSEADLRALDLPLPGEVTVVELPDGTREIRPVPRPGDAARAPFVCDEPVAE